MVYRKLILFLFGIQPYTYAYLLYGHAHFSINCIALSSNYITQTIFVIIITIFNRNYLIYVKALLQNVITIVEF